jgi:phage tail sheath gpL-like
MRFSTDYVRHAFSELYKKYPREFLRDWSNGYPGSESVINEIIRDKNISVEDAISNLEYFIEQDKLFNETLSLTKNMKIGGKVSSPKTEKLILLKLLENMNFS